MKEKKIKLARMVKRVKKEKTEEELAEEEKEAEKESHITEIDFLPIEEPFSYVRITLNDLTNEYVYNMTAKSCNPFKHG